MEYAGFILLGVFALLLLINVPISFSIGIATLVTMLFSIDAIPAATTIAQRLAGGINTFALLAIPFFILSGLIMGQGGIARRLIECAMALIGMLPGGLALVNVLSCTLFGSISGSAVAATSAIGSFMIPEMEKKGYDRNFSAAVTASRLVVNDRVCRIRKNERLPYRSAFACVDCISKSIGGYTEFVFDIYHYRRDHRWHIHAY